MSQADKRRQWVLSAVEQYELSLLRYAVRLLGNADLARDTVQHTFLKLCDQAEAGLLRVGQSNDRLAAWLFRVCRNRAIDHLRQAGREQSLEANFEDSSACRPHEPDSREGNPATAGEVTELAECLRLLVAHLPLAQREAITLWSEGFSYRQIGEVVGRQEGHVRVLVHRGLARLREQPQVQRWLEDETTTATAASPSRLPRKTNPVIP
jgi:RNA polymerase sigma-70 factor (ECF subfamily)